MKILTIHLLIIPEERAHARAAICNQWPLFNLQASGIQHIAWTAGEEPHPYRPGTKSVLLILFKYEEEVSTASVLSFIVLTDQFNDPFLIVSGA